jgi:hypothetical protein
MPPTIIDPADEQRYLAYLDTLRDPATEKTYYRELPLAQRAHLVRTFVTTPHRRAA